MASAVDNDCSVGVGMEDRRDSVEGLPVASAVDNDCSVGVEMEDPAENVYAIGDLASPKCCCYGRCFSAHAFQNRAVW